jgi:NAD(P)-dependent dehydrogenase (short-subunit alcohol dehydrogenase family)
MTRGILIAGNESSLLTALAHEAAGRVENFAVACVPNRFMREDTAHVWEGGGIPLSWNPGSPISARTMILSAENRLERIDEALLVCVPPSVRKSAADLTARDIEILVNDHVRGWFHLVREVASVFRTRRAGTLGMVFSDLPSGGTRGEKADILGSAALASFLAFSRSLLASSFDEPYLSVGFSSSAAGEDAHFASFVFKILDESGGKNNGKWYKFGRLNLFSR